MLNLYFIVFGVPIYSYVYNHESETAPTIIEMNCNLFCFTTIHHAFRGLRTNFKLSELLRDLSSP
jgi:hypothetical protein